MASALCLSTKATTHEYFGLQQYFGNLLLQFHEQFHSPIAALHTFADLSKYC
jgi:hypothetical protein